MNFEQLFYNKIHKKILGTGNVANSRGHQIKKKHNHYLNVSVVIYHFC